jgi:opacity protein-like surface antigen
MARFILAQGEEPAIRRQLEVIRSSESETRIPAPYNVTSVAVVSELSEVEGVEPVECSLDHVRIPAVHAVADVAASSDDRGVARNALDALDEPMKSGPIAPRRVAIDPSSLLRTFPPSSAFSGEGSQNVPASDAGRAGERLEGIRGWVGGFAGFSTGGAADLENGFLIGGNAAFFFLDQVGIEAGVHRRSTDVAPMPSSALSEGSLDSTIVTGGVVVRFPVSARVVPYVEGGAAYFSNSFEIDASLSGRLAALNFEATEEVESAIGFNVGGGVDVLVSRRLVVFGEVRYLDAASDTRAELRDTITGTTAVAGGSQDLKAVEILVGVRYVFPRGPRKAGKS